MPPAQTRCDLRVRIPHGYGPAANRLLENYRVRAGKPPGAIPADDQVNDPGGRRRPPAHADLAELADAQDSGSCARKGVGVRAPRSAPSTYRANGSSRHLGREAEPSSQRVVAQHGSAPRSGRGGRRFESVRPDTMPAGVRQPLGDDSLPGAITTAWPSGEAAGCNPRTARFDSGCRVQSITGTVRLPEGHWPFKPAGEGSNPSRCTHRGVEQLVAREPHKLKVAGSSPATPTTPT